MMGNRDMNLFATLYDGVALQRDLGIDIEFFEMLEMVQRSERLEPGAVSQVRDLVRRKWKFESPADDAVLDKGIRYYLAIRERALERDYKGISLIDVDGMKKLLQFPPAMIFMLLADELKICTIPENDAYGAVTQLITRALTGQIAAYLEFYDFLTDGALMGVPDYVPTEVVDGPILVRPSSFGQLAGGVLNISKMKTGQVTLCRLAQREGKFVLHLVHGTAKSPRPWEEAGWTPPAPQLPSIEFVLDGDMDEFANNVMGQHYILSYGDNTALFCDFCALRGIEVLR
jgi:L-fucose isomerase-like protein